MLTALTPSTARTTAVMNGGHDKLVLEDPEYCASVAFTVGSWIEVLDQVQRRLIKSPRTYLCDLLRSKERAPGSRPTAAPGALPFAAPTPTREVIPYHETSRSFAGQSPPPCGCNKVKTFFSKPHNVILLLMGIVLTITTVAPIVAIVQDTFKIHPGTIDAYLTGTVPGLHPGQLHRPVHQPAGQGQPVDAPAEHRSAVGRLPASWPFCSAVCSRSSLRAPIWPAANT